MHNAGRCREFMNAADGGSRENDAGKGRNESIRDLGLLYLDFLGNMGRSNKQYPAYDFISPQTSQ